MKTLIWMGAIAVAGTIGFASATFATPTLTPNGDYRDQNGRSPGYLTWEVVDADPKGLNCRMAEQFRPVSLDGADTPADVYRNYRHEVSQWEVLFAFRRGQRLNAVSGNMGNNQIMLIDRQGKPWLGVNTSRGDCFVRANSRFVRPIGAPGYQPR